MVRWRRVARDAPGQVHYPAGPALAHYRRQRLDDRRIPHRHRHPRPVVRRPRQPHHARCAESSCSVRSIAATWRFAGPGGKHRDREAGPIGELLRLPTSEAELSSAAADRDRVSPCSRTSRCIGAAPHSSTYQPSDHPQSHRRHNSRAGLHVRAELDGGRYPAVTMGTDEHIASIRLTRRRLLGNWNYVIHPTTSPRYSMGFLTGPQHSVAPRISRPTKAASTWSPISRVARWRNTW